MWKSVCMILLLSAAVLAGEIPQAEISNGLLDVKMYLPDARNGYYRGTRFDHSGNIFSLRYQGHQYFGQWFERYDPAIHDAIQGPVEEYLTNHAGIGYDEAKVGELFLRIGVGSLRKPEEKSYRRFFTYEIVDPGTWQVKKGSDWIEFTHLVQDTNGYAYRYQKRIRLLKNRPEMILEHTLKNTGKKGIETLQYNHNFFVIDGQPTGPDFVVRLPFDVRAKEDWKGVALAGDRQIQYRQELAKGQSIASDLLGFGPDRKDYDFRIENRKTGAGVRILGDRPLERLYYWSIRTTLCPEPYIRLKVNPGKTVRFQIRYQFYTLPVESSR